MRVLPSEVRWYRCGDEGLHGLPVNLLEHEQDLWALQDQLTLTARAQLEYHIHNIFEINK